MKITKEIINEVLKEVKAKCKNTADCSKCEFCRELVTKAGLTFYSCDLGGEPGEWTLGVEE